MKYAPVNAFLSGVRPCVVAMILATALSMALSTLLGLTDLQTGFAPDLRSINLLQSRIALTLQIFQSLRVLCFKDCNAGIKIFRTRFYQTG